MGAYFFNDFEQTSLGENFIVLSPGIEWATPRWDAHINVYFPTTTSQQSGSENFADTYGDYSHVAFSEGTHDQYDELVTPYAVIGNGVDSAVGYSFASSGDHLRERVYLGAYYYQAPADMEVANMTGATIGFSKAITKNLSVTMANSYDQVKHYNISLSLSLTFGGESNLFSDDISDRLLDSVQRHIGIIDTGAGQYDQQDLQASGKTALQYDDVYFTSSDGNGDGTYGNPMALDQESLDATNAENPDGAMIYVQGDSEYDINSMTGSTQDDVSGLYAYNNQDFYGRTSDYTAPANASDQPEIIAQDGYNGFITQSGENTFSELTISSATSANNTGIITTNSGDEDETLNIYNTTITQFSTGVSATNNSTGTLIINMINSKFNDNVGVDNAYGMVVNNTNSGNAIVNATNSQFNNNSASGNDANGFGMYFINSGAGVATLNASNSTFDGNSAGGSGNTMSAGLYAYNLGAGDLNVVVTHSSFNQNTASNNGYAYGLNATNTSSGNLSVNAINSQFNNNAVSGTGASNAIGLYASNTGNGNVTINAGESEFNNNSSEFAAYGMFVYNGTGGGSTSVSATDSQFNANDGEGFHVENASTNTASLLTVTDLSGSSFDDNLTYGIYATASSANTTTVNYTDVVFSGNGYPINNDSNVTYISS